MLRDGGPTHDFPIGQFYGARIFTLSFRVRGTVEVNNSGLLRLDDHRDSNPAEVSGPSFHVVCAGWQTKTERAFIEPVGMVDDFARHGVIVRHHGVAAVMSSGPLIDEIAPGRIDSKVSISLLTCLAGGDRTNWLEHCLVLMKRASRE